MFDAHPPFQIDGNFGCTAGIAEMLLQSQDGFIFVLPALPDAWKDGSVSGLKAKGGFIIDINWTNNKVSKIKIKSFLGGNCRVRAYDKLMAAGDFKLEKAEGKNPNPFFVIPDVKQPLISPDAKIQPVEIKKSYLYEFETEAGKEYILVLSR